MFSIRCTHAWRVFTPRLWTHASASVTMRIRGIITSPLPDRVIPNSGFHQVLMEKWDKFESNIGLVNGVTGESFKYSEIRQAVKNVASGLTKAGAKKGTVTCIYSPNCPEFVFTKLAVLSSGGTLTTANPAYTAEELRRQLIDSGAEYLIAHSVAIDVAKTAADNTTKVKQIFVIDGSSDGCRPFSDLLEDDGNADPSDQVEINWSKDLALIPYSSGTTGLPKGIVHSHQSLVATIIQARALKPIVDGSENFLGILPLFHVYGLTIIGGFSLWTCGKMVTMPKFDPLHFLSLIQKYKITILYLVPPLVQFLVLDPRVRDYDLSSVTRIFCGAAPLDKGTEKAVRTKLAELNVHADILQGYGLSENIVVHLCPPAQNRKAEKGGSVGLLLPNLKCKVLHVDTGKEVGTGEPGEIVVRGPTVMKGYFNKPEATKECLRDDWLYTGDVGYYDEDGYFFIVDRLKELIKYNALQIAPAELEGVLRGHKDVLDCAVIGRPDKRAGEVPTAFVVARAGAKEDDIAQYVAENVAEFKQLRGGVIFLEQIPKTPSGKILRRELKKLL